MVGLAVGTIIGISDYFTTTGANLWNGGQCFSVGSCFTIISGMSYGQCVSPRRNRQAALLSQYDQRHRDGTIADALGIAMAAVGMRPS